VCDDSVNDDSDDDDSYDDDSDDINAIFNKEIQSALTL